MRRPRRTEGSGAVARPGVGLLGEGVLDLLARLLEVALGLVDLALGLELLVAGGLAGLLLGLALEFLGLVICLIGQSHGRLPSIRRPPLHRGDPSPTSSTWDRAELTSILK